MFKHYYEQIHKHYSFIGKIASIQNPIERNAMWTYQIKMIISVVLQADNSEQMHRKFTRFFISVEAENANETADVGVFDLQDDAMTKFADNCANAVVETSKVQKEEISVAWTSPIEGSGCIILR